MLVQQYGWLWGDKSGKLMRLSSPLMGMSMIHAKNTKQISEQEEGRFQPARIGLTLFGDAQETDIAKTKYRVASCQSTGKPSQQRGHTLDFEHLYQWAGYAHRLWFYLVADGMGTSERRNRQ